jgi:hypothetical protein
MPVFDVYGDETESYAFREPPTLTENQQVYQSLVPDMTGTSRPRIRRCGTCGELLAKWEEPLTGLVLNKRRYDLSSTYDGVVTVSKRFRIAFEAANLLGLDFLPLPSDPDFFAAHASRTVAFDADRRRTEFHKLCPECGHYESVVGASPGYLKPGNSVGPAEFVRTDLEFGSGDEKSPLLLCGEVAARALTRAKLKGLELIPFEPTE